VAGQYRTEIPRFRVVYSIDMPFKVLSITKPGRGAS